MTVEAELVDQILADPDDEGAFSVYVDWLLERGDPRGIAIATGSVPGLLGPLANRADLTFDWYMGFPSGVQIVSRTTAHAMKLVTEVVNAQPCRFLRRMRLIVINGGDYPRIDRWLASYGKPTTLDTIVLGQFGEHAPSRMLRMAFPRLGRNG